MKIIDPLVTRPILHPRAPAHLYTFEVLQVKERILIPSFVISTFRFAFKSSKECEGAWT